MKLNKSRIPINFWLCFFLICALLYYLFFTVKGSIRRTLLNGYPWQAISSKIIEVPRSDHASIYTTDPVIKDKENQKQLYFSCYKKNGIQHCNSITNLNS